MTTGSNESPETESGRSTSRTQYDTGPGCKVCDARVLWREGMGWLHAADPVTCVPLFPNEDPADHEAEGSWE